MTMDYSEYKQFPHGGAFAGSHGDPHSLGYVYIIGFDEPGIVKIGSALSPFTRLLELQCGNPFELKVLAAVSVYSSAPVLIEQAAHKLAADSWIRGEWFELDEDEAIAVVLQAARQKRAKVGSAFAAHQRVEEEARKRIEELETVGEDERRRILRIKLGMDA